MKSITPALAILSLIVISGCSSDGSAGGDTPTPLPTETVSAQLSPTSRENFWTLANEATADFGTRDYKNLNTDANGANAYTQVGYGNTAGGLTYYAFAGLNQTDVLTGPIVTTGSVSYDAHYSINEIKDIAANSEEISYTYGELTLLADFSDNTITGQDDLLSINGTLTDGSKAFDGTVTWRGTAGEVEGMVSGTGMIGAFQGSSDNIVYAGTISGDSIPE